MKERKLITAIRQNNISQLEAWFGSNLDVNLRIGKYQDTLLHVAVNLKSVSVIEFLLDAGADSYLMNEEKITPIELAMLTHQPFMMEVFLKKGKFPLPSILTSICTQDIALFEDLVQGCEGDVFFLEDSIQSRYSLLHYLAALGRDEFASCLSDYLDFDPTVLNKCVSFRGKLVSPLMLACQYGHSAIVSWLLAQGADSLLKNEKEETALTLAIRRGSLGIVKQLVDKIPSLLSVLQEKNQQNHDAVEIALLNRQSEIALFLFKRCSLLFEAAQQPLSEHAYFHLAARCGVIAVLEAFLAKKTLVDLRNTADKTALMCAVEFDKVEAFQLLHQAGANLTLVDKEGNTVFLLAAKAGAGKILDYCLKQKIDIESENTQKETALMLAAGEAGIETLKLLLSHHANVHHENVYGSTMLHRAAYYSNWENILYLVKHHHLSVWKPTKSGDLPLDTCLQGGLRFEERTLQTEYTALKLVTLMYAYDLQQAYHHLVLLNAYSQRLVEHLRMGMNEAGFEERLGKDWKKLRNIKLNHLSEVVLTGAIARRLANLQRLLFEYVILFIHSPSVFQMLPQEVLVEKILCDVLKEKTNGLIDQEDAYLIHGILNAIREQIKGIQKVSRPVVRKPHEKVDETAKKAMECWVTQRYPTVSYQTMYTDLLQWIEKQGVAGINDPLPQTSAARFWKRTPLTAAIENGFEALVNHCLLWGANPNQPDGMGEYPLHLACYRGSLMIVGFLFRYDVKPSLHQRNARGNEPLHEAILGKNPLVLEMLLMHFYDFQDEAVEGISTWRKPQAHFSPLEKVNEYGETPLELAYTTHQIEMTELLLERHANFYRFIHKSPGYLNLPSASSDLEGFKYRPFLRRFFASCRADPYTVFEEMIHDGEHFAQLHQRFLKTHFYGLKFKILKFCQTVYEAMSYPTSQINVIRDFLTHFSLGYFLKKDRAVNFFRLKELLLDFQRKLNDPDVKVAMKQVSTRKETDDTEIQRVSKGDKRWAWQTVMSTIRTTHLFEEALSMKITYDKLQGIRDWTDWQYLDVIAFQIEAAKEIFAQLADKFPDEGNASKKANPFSKPLENRAVESILGLLQDFYQCVRRLTLYPHLKTLFLNTNENVLLKDFFLELLLLQKSIFKLNEQNKSKKDGEWGENSSENEVNSMKYLEKIQSIFKLLKLLSGLTVVWPEKQPLPLRHNIPKISHRFVFFNADKSEEVGKPSVLGMNFPKPQ